VMHITVDLATDIVRDLQPRQIRRSQRHANLAALKSVVLAQIQNEGLPRKNCQFGEPIRSLPS
jgi:hypothetical protein